MRNPGYFYNGFLSRSYTKMQGATIKTVYSNHLFHTMELVTLDGLFHFCSLMSFSLPQPLFFHSYFVHS